MPGKSKADSTGSRKMDLSAIVEHLQRAEKHLTISKKLRSELQNLRNGRQFVPKVLEAEKETSVRRAQESLHQIQEALDRTITIHFAIRKRMELLIQLEVQAKHVLIGENLLPENSSGPRVANTLAAHLPTLAEAKVKWEEMDKLCAMVQGHLGRTIKIIELQMKLDDNVRWAQYRG